jgi:hypothetical protein
MNVRQILIWVLWISAACTVLGALCVVLGAYGGGIFLCWLGVYLCLPMAALFILGAAYVVMYMGAYILMMVLPKRLQKKFMDWIARRYKIKGGDKYS